MIGRALMFLVAPMTMVMFPKIVQAAARAEKTDVLAQAIGATALLGGGAALFCTFFGDIPLRIVQGAKYIAAAPLIPWFTWCMLPLTVSNVLVNNLMARQRYGMVPWLVGVAAAYCGTLWCILRRMVSPHSPGSHSDPRSFCRLVLPGVRHLYLEKQAGSGSARNRLALFFPRQGAGD